jgi:hypothetical protein
VAGGFPVAGGNRLQLAAALVALAVDVERMRGVTLHLVPEGSIGLAAAAGPGLVLWHPDGRLGGAFDVVLRHGGGIGRAVLVGAAGSFGDEGVHLLQSALHGFDTHLLQGVSGQGLPVISQPLAERPLGRARVAGLPPAETAGYWSTRANPMAR